MLRSRDGEGKPDIHSRHRFAGRPVGVPVVLGGTEHFAVVVSLYPGWNRSMLYVFDPEGKLVLQELIGEDCEAIAALRTPGEERDNLLVGGQGRVWRFLPAQGPPSLQ